MCDVIMMSSPVMRVTAAISRATRARWRARERLGKAALVAAVDDFRHVPFVVAVVRLVVLGLVGGSCKSKCALCRVSCECECDVSSPVIGASWFERQLERLELVVVVDVADASINFWISTSGSNVPCAS